MICRLGDSVRPDAKMGVDAVSKANKHQVQEGNVGAGCGASVGKLGGLDRAMKSGIGTALDCTKWLDYWCTCSSERGRRGKGSAYE